MAQAVLGQGLADTGQVNRLAAGHAHPPRGARQNAAQARLHRGVHAAVQGRQHLKSQGLQSVTGQERTGLTKLHMHRGFATAQHIVVHARHIVVHQGIGMYQLHRAGRPHRCSIRTRGSQATDRLISGQHQQGPQSLAAIEHGIAHRMVQIGRGGPGAARRSVLP